MAFDTAYPDADFVRALLAESGVPTATIMPLGAGRTTVTYRADRHWIVQFPISTLPSKPRVYRHS